MKLESLNKIRRDLHQIPELGFKEVKTQAYLLNFIQSLPQDFLSVEKWETGIFIRVEGSKGNKTIGYRADIDGLPIVEETGLPFLSKHATNMHACGHDFHMTIALGLIEQLTKNRPEDNVVIIFQPAEEGPGGALPMLQTEQMKKWKPDVIFALHIAPELPVGTVSSKEGLLFANTSELFIDLHGQGGHAAYPHRTKDMVVAASSLVMDLQTIVSRMVNPIDAAVVTIGKITGGSVQNVIAEHARLEGTIRTVKSDTMVLIKNQIGKIAKAIEIRYDCKTTIDFGSNYYQVWNDGKYVNQFAEAMNKENITFVQAEEAMTGEDFGYMLKEIPGFMFWLGVDSPYGLHHSKLNPKEEALEVGVRAVEQMVRNFNL